MGNGKWEMENTKRRQQGLWQQWHAAHTHTHKEWWRGWGGGSGMLAKKNFSAVKTNLENLIKIAKLWQLIKFSRTRPTTQNGDQVESLKQATSQATHHSPPVLLLLPTCITPLPRPIIHLPLCLADDKFKFLNKPKGNVEKFTFAFVSPKTGENIKKNWNWSPKRSCGSAGRGLDLSPSLAGSRKWRGRQPADQPTNRTGELLLLMFVDDAVDGCHHHHRRHPDHHHHHRQPRLTMPGKVSPI